MADRLTRAAAIVETYADELDIAQRAVAALQSSWDAAHPADPMLPLPVPELARLTALHSVVLGDLERAGSVAAGRLRVLLAEVMDRDTPRRRALMTPGWADPAPSDEAVRRATLAELDIVAGAMSREEGEQLADRVMAQFHAIVGGDPFAAGRAVNLLGARVRDPVVAAALWSRLNVEDTARVLDALAAPVSSAAFSEWQARDGAALLTALGAALASIANPAYSRGLDVVTRSRLDSERGRWLSTLAESAADGRRRADGGLAGGAWVQGQLAWGARQAGLSLGVPYASTVAVAMVAADRAARSGTSGSEGGAYVDTVASGRHVVVPEATDDPLLAVAQALASDAEAARIWLLAPLPGPDKTLVVDHLMGGRYLTLDPESAAASMRETGELVLAVGSDPLNRTSTAVASAFLAAVAQTSQTTGYPEAFRTALRPALPQVGALLATHPDALSATLDDSAGLGVDARTVSDVERLTRSGRERQRWEIVLADSAAAESLLGELALQGSEDMDAGHPTSAPALAAVVDALGRRLEDDLMTAVRAEEAGDGNAAEVAAYRLGAVTGFVLTSAGEALAGRDAGRDARNAAIASVANSAIGGVAVPGLAGKAATPLLHYAAARAVSAALPTGSEVAQRQATAVATTAARDEAYATVRTLVSRAQPWTPEHSPQHWLSTTGAARGAVSFWDERGVPLPEDQMTTAQRRSFTDWRRSTGLSVYDLAPEVARHGIEAGITDALGARPARW
jgi:hypothetical protein